ncbi:uncharacterized protein LOC131942814 isoform X2 [Physella acuta]|nr:uncharacterized protein LOC131942814 isoform X2 [Physella acuta]XP_059158736.1 uncharacterized protein LOC131942814 isoform X2 [Physella acuta]XP_059158737.1 uncharacterized protein LOC131942814 isoform X2 [Physella acuta]
MTSTTDFKSPHEEVVTITESVGSGSKNPTKIARLSFFFIVASVIINWYYFIIQSNFYTSYGYFDQPTSTNSVIDRLKLFVFLCNNIAYVVICLHIFTSKFRGSKITAVITACVCIFTSACLVNQWSAKAIDDGIVDIVYALHIAAYFIQAITGLLMINEVYYMT